MEPCDLSATDAIALISSEKLRAEELVRSCLARIEAREHIVKAWAWIDPQKAVRDARELDNKRLAGGPVGVLNGIPFGVKDVIDTADMPTSGNSAHRIGYQPSEDASCVAIARSCGALLLGKTETVELAWGGRIPRTRNPLDPRFTPGGSSSGSAAAVADNHVPLSIGTQTYGSHIRPASFNAIYGYKPTHGLIPWTGAWQNCPSLDTIGWYSRDPRDFSLLARAFQFAGAEERVDVRAHALRLGIARTHNWDMTSPDCRNVVQSAIAALKCEKISVVEVESPAEFRCLNHSHEVIARHEARIHLLPEYLRTGGRMEADFQEIMADEARISPEDYLKCIDHAARSRTMFDSMFGADLDCIITPAAIGEPPKGYDTGDWVMCSIWTLLHAPCVAVPVGKGQNGLPIGVQIVGPRLGDIRLLEIVEQLAPILQGGNDGVSDFAGA